MSILMEAISGTFVEFRNGMINVSPIGRNATCAFVFLTTIYAYLTTHLIKHSRTSRIRGL